jgi:molybdopterin converting factor subunit 1
MKVTVKLFASLRERAGCNEVELELDDGARVADALAKLHAISGDVDVVMAVNREYADDETTLHAGDELALIPPVSGGAISDQPLSVDALLARVRDPRAGAVVTFSGVTREVDHLDYEAYAEMAHDHIERILAAAIERHGLCRAAADHRIGRVALGEPSVVVAVSAPHRGEAFAGAREIIDAIKAQAPLWKREHEQWVHGTPPTAPPAR